MIAFAASPPLWFLITLLSNLSTFRHVTTGLIQSLVVFLDHLPLTFPSIFGSLTSYAPFSHMSNTPKPLAHPYARVTLPGGTTVFQPPSLPPPSKRQKHPRLSRNPVNRPLPCSFHPKVLAADCFLSWLTPYV